MVRSSHLPQDDDQYDEDEVDDDDPLPTFRLVSSTQLVPSQVSTLLRTPGSPPMMMIMMSLIMMMMMMMMMMMSLIMITSANNQLFPQNCH